MLLLLLACRGVTPTTDTAVDADTAVEADTVTRHALPSPEAPPACLLAFPPLPVPEPPDTGADEPLPDVDPTDLVAHWPLDGDWIDVIGRHDLAPVRAGGFNPADVALAEGNVAYGPTGLDADNGAIGTDLTSVDLTAGLTLEMWLYKPSNNTNGTLMGWGDGTWSQPELRIADSWGSLLISAGRAGSRVTATFARPSAGCWHHVALVVPPDGVGALRLFLDGAEQVPMSGTLTIADPAGLFGSPFRLGTWRLPDSVAMRIDEARLWGRALSTEEVSLRAMPRGDGQLCPSTTRGWEPGPRCDFDDLEVPLRAPSTVRVLTDDTVVFLTDPSDALEARLDEACGAYLGAMEDNLATLDPWWWRMHYGYAALDTKIDVLPHAMTTWATDEFLLARTCADAPAAVEVLSRWTQPVSEWRVDRLGAAGGEVNTGAARTTLLTWARLPFRMEPGEEVALRDAWGNRVALTYDPATTVSWALKLAQNGFAADDPTKRVFLGHFMGPAGAMDLARFEGAVFQVMDEASGGVAFEGRVRFHADNTAETGELLSTLDFGGLTTPGRYHVVLPGAGRTTTFEIGANAMGTAFLAHARGLYHNRCAPLDPAVTPWARGDIHAVYQASFPPDTDDYRDHATAGWGFRDASGRYVSVSNFEAVTATATTTALPSVTGGWHDAGDFDRRPMHLDIVRDLALAYLLAPGNFHDGQLDLPDEERANGVPDVLDEAVWGLRAYRGAQRPDGGVGTWMEATSHPQEGDPGIDTQPYYLSVATRDSSLAYARHAALLARALAAAGSDEAEGWLASAEAAWAYGIRDDVRTEVRMTVRGHPVTWRERPTPDAERRMLAAVELLLATGSPVYREELDTEASAAAFTYLRGNAWWQLRTLDLASVALAPETFPAGWADEAAATITTQADGWMDGQSQWAYGWAWYPPDHRYVTNTGWGQGLYKPLREIVLAWKLTGDEAYRYAALEGVATFTGANGQGRSMTTGLGTHRFVTALHLPSHEDAIDEVAPGITIYGAGDGLAQQASTAVWGLASAPRTDPEFAGVDLALLPPPWDNAALDAASTRAIVGDVLPAWRRLVPLESPLPQNMEYTVWETVGPAMFVTGLLMEPGWTPTDAMLADAPLSDDALSESLWMMP